MQCKLFQLVSYVLLPGLVKFLIWYLLQLYYLGTGGGPEGVLAAAALDCLGGQMQIRLVLSNKKEIRRAENMGVKDINKKYEIKDMIKGDVIFCATGVTDGDILKGIVDKKDSFQASSFALHKSQKISKKITNIIKK